MKEQLALRTVTREVLGFYQQLGIRKKSLHVNCLDKDWGLTISAGAVPREGRLQLDIDWGGARCFLRFDEAWVWQMADAVLHAENLSTLPEALRTLTLDAAFASASSLIEEATRKRVSVLSVPVESLHEFSPDASMSCFILSLDDGNVVTEGEFWVDALGLGFLANATRQLTAEPLALSHFENLIVPLRFVVGRVDLPHDSLRDLCKGDVILFDECWLLEDENILLQIGKNAGLWAALERTSIIIKDNLGDMMQDIDSYEVAEETSIDSIGVRLTFDLGEREITLGELRLVASGYVFEMGRDLRRSVTIRANGHAIGEGELVDIEGQTGVSVLRLFNGAVTSVE